MLKDLLDQKKCFKLICGAGNENLDEVEKLVALYAKAGCRFFDLSSNEDVLKAAQRGLDFAIPKNGQKKYHFCISIGTKNDQHIQKAEIDTEKCIGCGKCIEVCPQEAIKAKGKRQKAKGRVGLLSHQYEIVDKKCIGCMRCQKFCTCDAIFFHPHPQLLRNDAQSFLRQSPQGRGKHLIHLFTCSPIHPTCIELHACDTDEQEVDEIWQHLNENFDGMLSICLGRAKLNNEQIINRIKRLIKIRRPYTTIIQADGSPMSGGDNNFKSTLQAVALAELIQNEHLPVYLILSGGTNSKTAELARLCGVDFNGIAMGSYARKIVKKYIEREDFFENETIFNEALKTALELINTLFN